MHGRVALLGALLLGGCAAQQPIGLKAPPGAPPGADGLYRGTARLVQSNGVGCPRSGPRTYNVQNGTVTVSYSQQRKRIPLTAQIQSDGKFQTADGVGNLDGQLRNGTLEFTIASATCEHRWTLTHVP